MRRRGFLLLGSLVFLSVLGRSSLAAPDTVVQKVTHATVGHDTRVAVYLSGHSQYRPGHLAEDRDQGLPERVYIDFFHTRLGPGVSRKIPVGSKILSQVRVAQFDPATVRVVLDMKAAGTYRTFHFADPFRVIIHVRGTASPARAAPDGRESLGGPERLPGRYKIVLDPGHGGSDPGAEGVGGVREKDVVLAVARRLASILRERLPVDVVLTRESDSFLSLEERTVKANTEAADLFISIHANASTNLSLHGVETYYLNNTEDRATIRLATMENGLNFLGGETKGGDLAYILSDLIQAGKEEESIALAHSVQRGMVDYLGKRYSGLNDLGVKKGPFYVLVGAYMPCVLVETAFLSHPREGRRLASQEYQHDIAEGLFGGLARFFEKSREAKNL